MKFLFLSIFISVSLWGQSLQASIKDSRFIQIIDSGSVLDSLDQFQTELDSARNLSTRCLQLVQETPIKDLKSEIKSSCSKLLNPQSNILRHFYIGEMYYRIGQAMYRGSEFTNPGLDLMEYGVGYYQLENEPEVQFELHRMVRQVEHCLIYSEFSAVDEFIAQEKLRLTREYPNDIEVNFFIPKIESWVDKRSQETFFMKKWMSLLSKMDQTCRSTLDP